MSCDPGLHSIDSLVIPATQKYLNEFSIYFVWIWILYSIILGTENPTSKVIAANNKTRKKFSGSLPVNVTKDTIQVGIKNQKKSIFYVLYFVQPTTRGLIMCVTTCNGCSITIIKKAQLVFKCENSITLSTRNRTALNNIVNK